MTYRLPPLNALRAFEAAARHMSFKKAAAELHVTPAAISHQIKALEDYLEVPLFRRLTRALELTSQGHALMPKLAEGFDNLAQAVERVRVAGESTPLRVSAPPAFASRWLVPRLHRFASAHPKIELKLTGTLNTVDSPESMPPLPGESSASECDVDIRFGNGRYPGFRVEPILLPRYIPACSPALLQGEHPLKTVKELHWQVLLHDDTVRDEASGPSWEEWLKKAGVGDVDPSRGLRFNNAALAIEAAVDGLGVVLALEPLIMADVASGRLVVPFQVDIPSRYAYYLVTSRVASNRHSATQFREWLLSEAKLAA
jgi:LysR family glycine cleavage system transcriptional activator